MGRHLQVEAGCRGDRSAEGGRPIVDQPQMIREREDLVDVGFPSLCSDDRTASYGIVELLVSLPAALKSVTVSVPAPPLNRSAPAPPISTSFPSPPRRTSSPRPPARVSLPLPPSTVSSPAPPLS